MSWLKNLIWHHMEIADELAGADDVEPYLGLHYGCSMRIWKEIQDCYLLFSEPLPDFFILLGSNSEPLPDFFGIWLIIPIQFLALLGSYSRWLARWGGRRCRLLLGEKIILLFLRVITTHLPFRMGGLANPFNNGPLWLLLDRAFSGWGRVCHFWITFYHKWLLDLLVYQLSTIHYDYSLITFVILLFVYPKPRGSPFRCLRWLSAYSWWLFGWMSYSCVYSRIVHVIWLNIIVHS